MIAGYLLLFLGKIKLTCLPLLSQEARVLEPGKLAHDIRSEVGGMSVLYGDDYEQALCLANDHQSGEAVKQ